MNPGGKGHNARRVLKVRELRKAGWSIRDVSRLMAEQGMPVATSTVLRWCNPKVNEREVARAGANLRRRRAQTRQPCSGYTEEWQLERMRELRARGLGYLAIGQVAAVWWGEELSRHQVRNRLGAT